MGSLLPLRTEKEPEPDDSVRSKIGLGCHCQGVIVGDNGASVLLGTKENLPLCPLR